MELDELSREGQAEPGAFHLPRRRADLVVDECYTREASRCAASPRYAEAVTRFLLS
jgi:hypothetical protein